MLYKIVEFFRNLGFNLGWFAWKPKGKVKTLLPNILILNYHGVPEKIHNIYQKDAIIQ